ncbi:MAG: hypothetical protein V4616_01845 [Bacteroidota bacterium]
MRVIAMLALLISTTFAAQAQNFMKGKSADYIRRTAFIIGEAHKQLLKLDSAQRDGKFALAIAHQRMARRSFEVADYKNAVYHSAYARRLAMILNSYSNKALNSKFKDTPEEMELVRNSPTDKVLTEQVQKGNPGIKFSDSDYLGDTRLYKLDVDDLIQP